MLTIRGDFMGRVLEHRELSDRLQDGLVTIGPMTRGELEETIVQPAAKTGLSFDKGLPETILDDVGEEPGGLPLLEFLLEGLWRERRGNTLTFDTYARLGRVSGAIAHRAEEVFERSLNETERKAAQRLLIRMVRPGEGVEDTRRRTAVPAADPVADAIIQKLARERLLVTERDAGTGEVTVEVAHEALIRRWRRLRDWIDADREFLRTRERVAAEAQLWEEEKRSPERLLPPGRPLAEGEDVLAKRRADLEPMLIDYIEASAAQARAAAEARQVAHRRRVRIAQLIAAAMTVLALLAIGSAGIAWWQRGEAQRSAAEAQRNQARALTALAPSEAKGGSPASAVRIALAALPADLAKPDRPYIGEAEGALLVAVQNLRERKRWIGGNLFALAISPDGRVLATRPFDGGEVFLWEMATGHEIAILRGHERTVTSAAFRHDGL